MYLKQNGKEMPFFVHQEKHIRKSWFLNWHISTVRIMNKKLKKTVTVTKKPGLGPPQIMKDHKTITFEELQRNVVS